MSKPVEAQSDLRSLSVARLAELVGLNPDTVEKHCRAGTIPSFKIGRNRRIPLSYLENLHQATNPVDVAVEAIIAAAPPLSKDQRNRISALLRTGSEAGEHIIMRSRRSR